MKDHEPLPPDSRPRQAARRPAHPKAAPIPLSPSQLSWLMLEQKRTQTPPKPVRQEKHSLLDLLRKRNG